MFQFYCTLNSQYACLLLFFFWLADVLFFWQSQTWQSEFVDPYQVEVVFVAELPNKNLKTTIFQILRLKNPSLALVLVAKEIACHQSAHFFIAINHFFRLFFHSIQTKLLKWLIPSKEELLVVLTWIRFLFVARQSACDHLFLLFVLQKIRLSTIIILIYKF